MMSFLKEDAEQQILQAVNALFQFIKANPENKKNNKQQLLKEGEENITLSLVYKKIPNSNRSKTKIVKISIPNSVFSEASICLFVKDDVWKKRNIDDDPVVFKYKELLASGGVKCVNEILTLHQLRTEFKPFEARRHLCNSHDLFLSDIRIWKFLPELIGKEFWRKKRIPVSVNLQAKNIAREFDKVLHQTYLYIDGRGSMSTIKAARVSQGVEKVVENVTEILKKLPDVVPGGWKNVRGIYIKTANTVPIPVYLSIDSANKVILPKPKNKETILEDEHPHHPNEMVQIHPNGHVTISRKRKVESTDDVEEEEEEEESSDEETDFVDLITKRRRVVTRKPKKMPFKKRKARKTLKRQRPSAKKTA